MKDTILFDMDGTLVDSLGDLTDSVNYTLKYLGYEKRSIDEVRSFVGDGAEMLIKRSLPKEGQRDFDNAIKIYKEHYSNNLCNKTRPYEGIYELIEELNDKGYKIGVVTNKPIEAAKIIADKLFGKNISVVVGAEPLIREKKPHKAGVDYCIEILKSNVKNAVFIGDSEVDVETAKNSSIPCIGVTWGFRSADSLKGADYIVNSSDELRTIILDLD